MPFCPSKSSINIVLVVWSLLSTDTDTQANFIIQGSSWWLLLNTNLNKPRWLIENNLNVNTGHGGTPRFLSNFLALIPSLSFKVNQIKRLRREGDKMVFLLCFTFNMWKHYLLRFQKVLICLTTLNSFDFIVQNV